MAGPTAAELAAIKARGVAAGFKPTNAAALATYNKTAAKKVLVAPRAVGSSGAVKPSGTPPWPGMVGNLGRSAAAPRAIPGVSASPRSSGYQPVKPDTSGGVLGGVGRFINEHVNLATGRTSTPITAAMKGGAERPYGVFRDRK